jgi:Glucodextranase, domain B/PASTA domain
MRTRLVSAALITLAAATGLSACGADEPPRPEPRVTLRLTTPADAAVVREDSVRIAGRVTPAGAAVTVLGEETAAEDGTFTATVPLEPGANVVDVAAAATGRRAAFAALRIVREVRVRVPELTGQDADGATERLAALGLEVEEERGGGLFDPLFPGDPVVCESRPRAGAELLPGSTVVLVVARRCG